MHSPRCLYYRKVSHAIFHIVLEIFTKRSFFYDATSNFLHNVDGRGYYQCEKLNQHGRHFTTNMVSVIQTPLQADRYKNELECADCDMFRTSGCSRDLRFTTDQLCNNLAETPTATTDVIIGLTGKHHDTELVLAKKNPTILYVSLTCAKKANGIQHSLLHSEQKNKTKRKN